MCQQRIVPVNMPPPGLNDSDLRVSEARKCFLKEVCIRNEVGIKDYDEFTFGSTQALIQSARLVSNALIAMNVLYLQSRLFKPLNFLVNNARRFVCGVIQDLHFGFFSRIINPGYRIN